MELASSLFTIVTFLRIILDKHVHIVIPWQACMLLYIWGLWFAWGFWSGFGWVVLFVFSEAWFSLFEGIWSLWGFCFVL